MFLILFFLSIMNTVLKGIHIVLSKCLLAGCCFLQVYRICKHLFLPVIQNHFGLGFFCPCDLILPQPSSSIDFYNGVRFSVPVLRLTLAVTPLVTISATMFGFLFLCVKTYLGRHPSRDDFYTLSGPNAVIKAPHFSALYLHRQRIC